MQTIWYFLIHVSLGLIGWKIFTFTNQGVLAAFAVCSGVQAWPMYEMFRLTHEKFEGMRSRLNGSELRKRETRGYWIRIGRLYLFRSCAYALLTLFVAWLMRGA
ncbi:MAG: hypothetical protein CFH41_01658 [Alphaproteobacteria bacterium MarineAlpha11_Bin1]|nr:MAG: hypothetical protein CFH41_01658 [Alphaproteobacteria bacterium MarineAlpha11_Bin1]